jgi:DNA-binding transcriptional ArsR family regulator
MATPVEPRFARIASAIADPTRARMLAILLGGEHRSAGELARGCGITAQAASTQLAQLCDANLIVSHSQGRHKYFALADADVAHALEALSLLAERDTVSQRWQSPHYAPLKYARRCYGHLAGELGVQLCKMLVTKGYVLAHEGGDFQISASGRVWLKSLGLEEKELPRASSARLAYPCMDWSERQPHLAGALATQLLKLFIVKGWLQLSDDSRALTLSASGKRVLLKLLG